MPVGFLSTVISAWDCLQRKNLWGQQPSQITCGWELSCATVGTGVSWSGSTGLYSDLKEVYRVGEERVQGLSVLEGKKPGLYGSTWGQIYKVLS